MRSASLIILAIAVVLGLAAVFGVRAMLNSGGPTEIAQAPVQRTARETVVVTRVPLEFGTEIERGMLREIEWVSDARPEGSFSSIDDIIGDERRVALRAMAPGEAVLAERISGFGGRAALSQVIEEGMRAVSIRVNDVTGAAGFVLPGDHVDIVLTVQPSRDPRDAVTNVIIQNVRVLAIDQIADENQGGAVVARAATVEVDIEDAQRIALAQSVGALSLALRNTLAAAGAQAEGVRTITYADLGPAEPEAAPSPPPAPRPRATATRRPSRPAIPPFTDMTITRGLETSEERVMRDQTPLDPETGPESLLAGGVPDRLIDGTKATASDAGPQR